MEEPELMVENGGFVSKSDLEKNVQSDGFESLKRDSFASFVPHPPSDKGYALELFLKEVSPSLLCLSCGLVLRDPFQSSCGHRFCATCSKKIQEIVQTGDYYCNGCTEDGVMTNLKDDSQFTPDRAANREVFKSKVQCLNQGCDFQDTLKKYLIHEKECEFKPQECPNGCGMVFLKDHISVCPYKTNTCLECGADFKGESHACVMDTYSSSSDSKVDTLKIAKLEKKIEKLNSVVEIQQEELIKAAETNETLKQSCTKQHELIKALIQKCSSLQRNITLRDITLAEQELRINALESTSNDGTFIWKITNFNQKWEDGKSGATPSIYSPFFYTSRNGYKLCVRLYPNGDGYGKGTHLSVFLVLMRGEYDALLSWPFKQRTTFMLLDQENREHIVDSFNPDPKSASFMRPNSDMNIASGCPMFVPLENVKGEKANSSYIKDDTMYIKIIVDCSNLTN